MLRALAHDGLRDAVEHDGDQRDRHALLHRLADLQLLKREQQLLTEARGADERGDDHHGQRLHDDLVEAEQQGLFRRRNFDLPQQLARRAARHAARLDDVLRHGADAEHRAACHGRQRKAERRQHGRHLAEAEEDHRGAEIGHVRRGLHHVENGIEHALGSRVAGGPDAERQPQHGRERHRHHDDGESLHGIRPQAEDGKIEGCGAAEDGKPSVPPAQWARMAVAPTIETHGSGCKLSAGMPR